MPSFGKTSENNLIHVDYRLVRLFRKVVENFDCTILSGYRSPSEQYDLYKKGRAEIDGVWQIVDKSQVVTYKDGYKKISLHNYGPPSLAVDVTPWPIDWKDKARLSYFAGYVKSVAFTMGYNVKWGADWNQDTHIEEETFKDWPHFQIED